MLKLKKFLSYLIIPVFFFLFHLFLYLVLDIYKRLPGFSNIMHFLGGVILAITFFSFLNYLQREGDLKINKLMNFIFVISLVISVAVFWEFYEFVMDYFFNVNWQISVADTMGDLALGIIGGITVTLVFLLKK